MTDENLRRLYEVALEEFRASSILEKKREIMKPFIGKSIPREDGTGVDTPIEVDDDGGLIMESTFVLSRC